MFGVGRSVTALLIGAVIAVVAAVTLISNYLYTRTTEAVEEGQFRIMEAIYTSGIKSAEGRALARAQMIADLPSTKAIFAPRDQSARDRLLAEYGPLFEVQSDKYGVDQMQFHVPPAISFLRFHAPGQFGDDLTAFRPLVVAVNRDQIARQAAAIARTGPAIFGVVPVYDAAGAHLGTFEVGIDFGPLLDGLKADYNFELALFILEDPLRQFVSPEVSAPLLNDNNRVGRYIKTYSTHWDLLKQLVTSGDVAVLDGAKRYTQSANETTFGVVLMPIRNFSGDPLGFVAVAQDFGPSRAAAGRLIVLQILLAIFAIVILAGVILIVVRGLLLDPLAELRTLRTGRGDAPDGAP